MIFDVRTFPTVLATAVAACALSACATEETSPPGDPCLDGKCDQADDDDACAREGRYHDGACDPSCGEPDLDCFVFFDDDAAARAWFQGWEAVTAAQLSRQPREVLPENDPRVAHMRELLDRGWAAYAEALPVGELTRAPGLVVIDDPEVNAFVAADHATHHAAWTVMVQRGVFELGMLDHEILGVVMHELTHAVKLHAMPEVADRIRKHYQVFPGEAEPFGYAQADEPVARAAVTAWRELGLEAGPWPRAELHGIPLGQTFLGILFAAAIERGKAADAAACAPAAREWSELLDFMKRHASALDGDLHLAAADASELEARSSATLAALRDQCLAGSTLGFVDLAASHFGTDPAVIESGLSPEDRALIAGRHVVDQIAALAAHRYQRMGEVAAKLQEDTGADLGTLRFYSFEEAADDSTVPVLAAAGLPADGAAAFFLRLLGAGDAAECRALIDQGSVPGYGPLTDEHHGTCWRARHVEALAARAGTGQQAARRVPEAPDARAAAYARLAGARLPRFHLATDDRTDALTRVP